MVKLFNVYHSKRTLFLVGCELVLVSGTFLSSAKVLMGTQSTAALIDDNGWLKILGITAFTLLLNYYFDLYEPRRISEKWETYFRVLLALSLLSFVLGGLLYLAPGLDIGRNVVLLGVSVLTFVLLAWRRTFEWISGLSLFSEHVYVLGCGSQARTVIDLIRSERVSGMQVVGCSGEAQAQAELTQLVEDLDESHRHSTRVDRVIVAVEDRRERFPTRELLDLRLHGVVIENCSTLMERLSGRLPLEGLYPSTLIFADGFRLRPFQRLVRRILSFAVALIALSICLPFIPVIILAVRMSSPGPVLFRQTRVGRFGKTFTVFKFRTMRQDAEKNGAVWAKANDPRVTRLGKMMRKTRLDEIPQLWNVLRGDMAFVGPRPERPEFVEWLRKDISFYDLRNMVLPGLTGWAQVRFQYGASLEDTKRKLEYDLYYIKHQSIGLDLLVMFETIKTIVLRRGAQ
ncbi:MAG TPA: TIGR03013 family XrtA/PEP-CTERM system glycosyltransferase [Terracidiphilus sp.]